MAMLGLVTVTIGGSSFASSSPVSAASIRARSISPSRAVWCSCLPSSAFIALSAASKRVNRSVVTGPGSKPRSWMVARRRLSLASRSSSDASTKRRTRVASALPTRLARSNGESQRHAAGRSPLPFRSLRRFLVFLILARHHRLRRRRRQQLLLVLDLGLRVRPILVGRDHLVLFQERPPLLAGILPASRL